MRSRFLIRVAARAGLVGLVLVGALAAPAAAQKWHEDERYGFKLLPPRGWKPIPLKTSENWLVAKFLSDEADHWNTKGYGWTREHRPELMVIAFVEEAIEKANRAVDEAEDRAREEAEKEAEKEAEDEGGDEDEGEDEGEDGGEGDGEEKVIALARPYADYEDYLDRTYSGGGFYVSEREKDTLGSMSVTKLEIKVEKLARTEPMRIITWVFHAEGVDLAVQFEMLEDSYSKHKSTVRRTLRSFKSIPRTEGPLPTETGTDSGLFISFSSMNKGTPTERKQKRLESEMRLHARAKQSMPEGWKEMERERFLVLYATDTGFAKKVAEHAEGLLEWADEKLGFIGAEEYVRRPVLRICATRAEMESLQRGVRDSGYWGFNRGQEIVTCKDEYGASGWQMGSVNRSLIDLWMRDRDDQLWMGMPQWVRHGLYEYAEGARVRGRKLVFRDYRDDFTDFREAVQKKKNIPVRELVQMTSSQFNARDGNWAGYWNRQAQADMLVRFLLSPKASRSKRTKTLLFDYLETLRDVVVELEGMDLGSEPQKEPETEEEEAEQYKKRNEAWKDSKRETEVLRRTFQRTFGSWSLRDWRSFEKAFLKFAS